MEKIKDFFKINDSYKTLKYCLLASLIVGLLAYNIYIIFGYTNPDGIIEGLTSYINATWHIVGCGRWMIPIILSFSANVHMPLITVLGYCLAIGFSAFIIGKLFNENKPVSIVIMAIVMSVSNSTIFHLNYNVVALPFALAGLASCLYVYLVFNGKGIFNKLLSIACITILLAIYQPYIGMACVLVLMKTIIDILEGKSFKELFKKLITALLSAIIGAVLYFIALKLILFLFNLNTSSRMADISIVSILTSIIPSIKKAYLTYFEYLNDSILLKKYLYGILIVLLIIALIMKKAKPLNRLIAIVLCLFIPLASNIIIIATPDSDMLATMTYQTILIVPFIIYLVGSINKKYIYLSTLVIAILLNWTYIISANATFTCYKMSYQSINYQMSSILDDIMHHEGYILNETPVIFIGYPNDEALRENINTYKYAYGLDFVTNVAFWENGTNAAPTYNRRNYFLDYFGIDLKEISFNEYSRIAEKEEVKKMDTWPTANSIQFVDDYLVVKIK